MKRSLRNTHRLIDLRTLAGLALTFASLVAVLVLVSCAPKLKERVYPVAKTDFGTLQTDPDLGLSQKTSATAANASQLTWKDTVETARVLRFAETLNALGESKSSLGFTRLGQKIGSAFYKSKGTTTSHAFDHSLYISAAIGGTKSDVLPIIEENDEMLAKQISLIHQLLADTSAHFPWPTATTPIAEGLAAAKSFAKEFLASAEASKMNRDVYEAVEKSLTADFFPLINAMSADVDSILAEPRSVTMIHRIKTLAKKYAVDLGADTSKQMDQAEAVMLDIEAIDRNHDALTVIVELWEMTDPENREKTFKPVAESLYNYLKNKGPGELACIKNPRCLNPILMLPKRLVILPAIEKYGLEKLKADLDKAAHDSLVKQITEAINKFVPTIPHEIDQKVSVQITAIRKKLANVKDDYPGFVRGIAREFARERLSTGEDDEVVRLKGLESKRVKVQISSHAVSIDAADSSSEVTSGGEAIGASLSYAASLWASQPRLKTLSTIAYRKSVLSQINKMLAMAGFPTSATKVYPSISISLDPEHPNERFDAAKSLSGKIPYAVPDAFNVTEGFQAEFKKGGKNVSIAAQAELLRGLSSMVRYFRDWKKNDFDSLLGADEIGKFVKDLPAGSVKQKLFPKDTFFALALANGADILLNMTRQMTPVFLIDINHKPSWANERQGDDIAPATMAGLVDIVQGERSNVVHAPDAARFLLAVADVLDAISGIEETHAAALLKPGADGQRPIDLMAQARQQLSLLIVGIGNFISHEMVAKDGGILSTYRRDTVSPDAAEPRKAVDQAICILALVKASDVIGKKIYEWPALDAYAFMNRKLWNPATGFYAASESSKVLPAADEIATILLAGEALKSRMTDKSQEQWKLIANPWMKAFEGLGERPASH